MHAPKYNKVFRKLFHIINAAFWRHLFKPTNAKNWNIAKNDRIGINNLLIFICGCTGARVWKKDHENISLGSEENYINLQLSKCSGGENVKGYNFSGIFFFFGERGCVTHCLVAGKSSRLLWRTWNVERDREPECECKLGAIVTELFLFFVCGPFSRNLGSR